VNLLTSPVVGFNVKPQTSINLSAALTTDADGDARPIVAGERFAGFATQSRQLPRDENRMGVTACVAGLAELPVQGFRASDIGKKVFAKGPLNFSVNLLKGESATEIGLAVAAGDAGKAIVKFSV
jgi:hypothetical protein